MAEAFFYETEECRKRITELFDFAWPTAAALWNLRWQVQGFLREVPDATKDQLSSRFLFGSETPSADLRVSCVQNSWDNQKAVFAGFILTNAIASYEYWTEALVKELGASKADAKKLQFPDDKNKGGLQSVVVRLQKKLSPALNSELYPRYAAKKKYSYEVIDNLLKCYRYFKELRNCIMHGGGVATKNAETAYEIFNPVSDRASLKMRGKLEIEPVVAGEPISLNLRGVVGFSDVLIRIVHSVDAELMRTKKAESTLKRRLSERRFPTMLSSNPVRRHKQIVYRFATSGLSQPKQTDQLYELMRKERLIQV